MDGGVASERCLFGAIVYEVAIVGKLMRDVEILICRNLLRGLPTGNWSIGYLSLSRYIECFLRALLESY